jgi:hypothetical protein
LTVSQRLSRHSANGFFLLLVPKLRPNRIGWFSLRLEFRSWALKQEDIFRNKYIDPTRQSRKPSTVLSFLGTA